MKKRNTNSRSYPADVDEKLEKLSQRLNRREIRQIGVMRCITETIYRFGKFFENAKNRTETNFSQNNN